MHGREEVCRWCGMGIVWDEASGRWVDRSAHQHMPVEDFCTSEDTIYVPDMNGFLRFRLAPGRTCEIVDIEVANEHRRTGVGRWLLAQLEAQVRGQAEQVYALTRVGNRIAQDFYIGTGFRRVALLPDFYPGGNGDAVLFARGVK